MGRRLRRRGGWACQDPSARVCHSGLNGGGPYDRNVSVLSGLLVEGRVRVLPGNLGALALDHGEPERIHRRRRLVAIAALAGGSAGLFPQPGAVEKPCAERCEGSAAMRRAFVETALTQGLGAPSGILCLYVQA